MKGRVHDIVVVGAGPAGSTVATLLATRGRDVLLLDRARFPRAKPCGESLNPGAVRELRELDILEEVRALPHRGIRGWRVEAPDGRSFGAEYPEGEFGVAVDRASLDALLLDKAAASGVNIELGVRVCDVLWSGAGIAGIRTSDGRRIPARLVIGADGIRSVIVRRLGLLRRGRLRKVGLTAHVRGALLPEDTGVLFVRPWGCIGAVSIGPDLANVVVVLTGPARAEARGGPAACFDRLIGEAGSLATARRCSRVITTGPFDSPTRAVAAPGALLVGDAAGYFDPFTGQGVYKALRSARAAADAVTTWTEAVGESGALHRYDRWHHRAFAAPRRLQRVIETGAAHPAIFGAAVSALGSLPALADRLISVTGDLLPVPALVVPSKRIH